MIAIRLVLESRCPSCSRDVPIERFDEAFACPDCGTAIAIGADDWGVLLHHATGFVENTTRSRGLSIGERSYRLEYTREWPPCAECGAFVDPDSLVCKGCGLTAASRRAPDVLTRHIAGARWLLHEGRPGGWYLAYDESIDDYDGPDTNAFDTEETTTSVVGQAPPFRWQGLSDVVVDHEGNLYAAGGDDRPGKRHYFIVWSLDANFEPRWIVENLAFDMDTTRLCLDKKSQRLIVWSRKKVQAVVLSTRDGGLRDQLGWREPESATFAYLETRNLHELEGDFDGTLLGLVNNRVVRWNANGLGLPTWASRVPLLSMLLPDPPTAPLYKTVGTKRKKVVGKPTHPSLVEQPEAAFAAQTRLTCGWDQRTYMVISDLRQGAVACYERTGKRRWHVPLGEIGEPMPGRRVGADAEGRCYVLITRRKDLSRHVYRISPDGKDVAVFLRDWREDGPLGTEERLVVGPDGRVAMVDSLGRARLYGADGAQIRATNRSERARQEAIWLHRIHMAAEEPYPE
jgi:hypothetical protein